MKILNFLISLVLSELAFSQAYYPRPWILKNTELKGPVKMLAYEDNCEPPKSSGMYDNLGCSYIIEFNRSGFSTSVFSKKDIGPFEDMLWYSYQHDSILRDMQDYSFGYTTKYSFEYTASNKMVSIETIPFYGKPQLQLSEYDEQGNLVLFTSLWIDGKKSFLDKKIRFTYNPNQQLICEEELDVKDKPFKITTHEYDNYGNLTTTKTWNRQPKRETGAVQDREYEWQTYTYDEAGNLLADSLFLDAEREPAISINYMYNDKGLLVLSEFAHHFHDIFYWVETEYDSLGRKKAETSFNDHGMYAYTLYAYNEKGQLELEEEHESTYYRPANDEPERTWRVTRREEYVYDHYGNWIKKYYLSYDDTEKVITREITYYE